MDQIRNAQPVIERFGNWPSFHDAEIQFVTLQRGLDSETPGTASLTMAIQCWALAPEGGPLSQCKVTLRFHGLVLQGLEHFGSQNVIFELVIVDIAEDPLDTSTTNHYRSEVVDSMRFRVWLDMSWGCSGSFGCAAIEVLSVEPVG